MSRTVWSDWQHMLDELCRRGDPITYLDAQGRIWPVERMLQGLFACRHNNLAKVVGMRHLRDGGVFELFAPTPGGKDYWDRMLDGRIGRPKSADERSPIRTRHSMAAIAAATAPREVWDLGGRTPWTWKPEFLEAREIAYREPRRPMTYWWEDNDYHLAKAWKAPAAEVNWRRR